MHMNEFNPPNHATREGLSPSPHHDEDAEAQRGAQFVVGHMNISQVQYKPPGPSNRVSVHLCVHSSTLRVSLGRTAIGKLYARLPSKKRELAPDPWELA